MSKTTQKQTTVFTWNGGGSHVLIASTFTEWKAYPMSHKTDGSWFLRVDLVPGTYCYKFVVDGEWCNDPSKARTPKGENVVVVKAATGESASTPGTKGGEGKGKEKGDGVAKGKGTKRVGGDGAEGKVTKKGGGGKEGEQQKPEKEAAKSSGGVSVEVPEKLSGAVRKTIDFGRGSIVVVHKPEDLWHVVENGHKLRFGENLRSVYLSAMGLDGKEGANLVLEPLKEKNNVTTLNLSYNPLLGDDFVEALVSLLPSTSIQHLSLSGCDLTDASARRLADYLSSTHVLTSLQLRSNRITAAGAGHLSRSLARGTCSLTSLDLWCNPLGEEGLVDLAKAVRQSKSLKELHVGGNGALQKTSTARAEWLKTLTDNSLKLGLTDLHLIVNDRTPFTKTIEELKMK